MRVLAKCFLLILKRLSPATLLLIVVLAGTAQATEPPPPPVQNAQTGDALWHTPIRFFQKVISRADGHRCPMHPSCSHYADQAFKRHGFFKGWVLTCDRLLRCGRDETRLRPSVNVQGIPHCHDPLEANTFWWDKR